jgi:ribosomal protein S27AE
MTMTYDQVDKQCWRCGHGTFELMPGSNYQWQCDTCGYVGHQKVTDGLLELERKTLEKEKS